MRKHCGAGSRAEGFAGSEKPIDGAVAIREGLCAAAIPKSESERPDGKRNDLCYHSLMAQVIIRNLDEGTMSAFKARAQAHGRSLEGELRRLLSEAKDG